MKAFEYKQVDGPGYIYHVHLSECTFESIDGLMISNSSIKPYSIDNMDYVFGTGPYSGTEELEMKDPYVDGILCDYIRVVDDEALNAYLQLKLASL